MASLAVGFSLSSTLYYSVKQQKKEKERKKERGERKGNKEWTFVTLMTTVVTVYQFQVTSFFLGEEHYTLHRDVHNDILNFVQDTRLFLPLPWMLINDLCSLRLWGFMLWVYKSYKLISIHQAETPLNLMFHFHSQRVHAYKYQCQGSTALSYIPQYGKMAKPESKNRRQHGIPSNTTRLSLKLSREHDETTCHDESCPLRASLCQPVTCRLTKTPVKRLQVRCRFRSLAHFNGAFHYWGAEGLGRSGDEPSLAKWLANHY